MEEKIIKKYVNRINLELSRGNYEVAESYLCLLGNSEIPELSSLKTKIYKTGMMRELKKAECAFDERKYKAAENRLTLAKIYSRFYSRCMRDENERFPKGFSKRMLTLDEKLRNYKKF